MALTSKLRAIGDAIRAKTGGTDALTLDQMATEIDGISGGGFDTSQIKNATYLFENSTLDSIDVSDLDLSNAVTISYMFKGCKNIKNVDMSSISVKNCIGMFNVFEECSSLENANIDFAVNPEKALSISNIFKNCKKLARVSVGSIKITSGESSFYFCNELSDIDLSKIDTSSCTTFNSMFCGCYLLDSVNVSSFVTSSVTNFGSMFSACHSLNTIDISGFDFSRATNISYMFNFCKSLTEIKGLNRIQTCTNENLSFSGLFYGCSSLEHIDMTYFSGFKPTSLYGLFSRCESLREIDLSMIDTSKCTSFGEMFGNNVSSGPGCTLLTDIDLSMLDTSSLTYIARMFYHCKSLETLNVGTWDCSKITSASNVSEVFGDCPALTNFSGIALQVSSSLKDCVNLTVESLLNTIDKLPTVTTAQTLTLGTTNKAKLTDEQIQVAIDKGWTVA